MINYTYALTLVPHQMMAGMFSKWVCFSPLYFFAASPLLAPFSESAPFVHIALELSTAHPWVQYICILEFRDAFGIYITNIPSGIKDEVKQSIQLSQPARDT